MKYINLTYNESVLSLIEGITATSAQHLCNIAKEMYADIESRHATLQFYNEKLQALTGEPILLSKGLNKEDLINLMVDVQKLTNLKAFIAYFKEAIKYKETLYKQMLSTTWHSEYQKDFLKLYPATPVKKTLDVLVSELPIGERCRYYTLETVCAVKGGFVHPNGGLSRARKVLLDKKNNPAYLSETAVENIIHRFEPSVSVSDVDTIFFDLQQDHRRAQAELNKFKSDLEKTEELRYNQAMSKYNLEVTDIANRMRESQQEYDMEHNGVLQTIQQLKIIVPHSLQDLQHELSSK
ncbi:MAG: hypothetical protein J6V44_11580 [Methanobrevibacter sp.]|nr:hypothetical protein [Methanobrevibacter sp.]